MSIAFRTYRTGQLDRLDLIAASFDISVQSLIRANPMIGADRFSPVLPAGVELLIPAHRPLTTTGFPTIAPPWKTAKT
jgi:hypothetical protein